MAELYLKIANTLERSAQLAEMHAERDRACGRWRSADREMERARRARRGASRGRTLARNFEELPDVRGTLHDLHGTGNIVIRRYHEIGTYQA